jgi:predicted transcriptional regulator/N-acetylglutamate synthase-like GNAT family acetyltransferase
MYPSIKRWLHHKVGPGLANSQRTAFLLKQGSDTVAAAVLKRSTHAKICHVQINRDLRNHGIGKLLFCLAALEFGSIASEVHFTLPESLWAEEEAFFSAFGFSQYHIANDQYRDHNSELFCTASFRHFWMAALEHFPHVIQELGTRANADSPALLMSIKPRFADAILKGRKVVEIRKTFSQRWINERVSLYASRPEQSLVGEARITDVKQGTPEEVWFTYGSQTGCTRQEFDCYSRGARNLFAICLSDVHPYEIPLPLSAIRAVAGKQFTPPQSYSGILAKGKGKSIMTLAHAVDASLPSVMF